MDYRYKAAAEHEHGAFKLMRHLFCFFLISLASALCVSHAEERLELKETKVTGNPELPKITYIVPWQASQLPDKEAPPLDQLIDDALMPLDRDVLLRRIHYFHDVSPATQKTDEPPGKPEK